MPSRNLTTFDPTAPTGDILFDNWTNLSFKKILGTKQEAGRGWLSPTWVGDHARRLMAYKILQSYIDNSSRWFRYFTASNGEENHREYGDAELIRNQILAALLGDDQTIVVDGAEDFDSAADSNPPDSKAKSELEDWLTDWAWNNERFGLKMIETERNSVGLGDGVYTLGWDPDKGRVRLRVWDPGFYFPVLSDQNEDEFPQRVHIAWEMEDEASGEQAPVVKIRRITWELLRLPNGGTRKYEWNDKPSQWYCAMSDGMWTVDRAGKRTVDDLSGASVQWRTFTDDQGNEQEFRQVDLGIDFLPVVHLPNTVSLLNHYGKSSIATVLQILDDLANADTDLQASSATTGKPPIALGGAAMASDPTYKPGEVWAVGDGTATMIDTSKALDALLKYVEAMLKRLAVNSRVPESVLGRVEISGQISGIALALSFGPLETMVREMRLVRDEKYPLLLKFNWRMSRVGDPAGTPTQWFPTRLEMGRFLPSDQKAMVDMVTELVTAKAISAETGVRMLMTVGFNIEDAKDEVLRIQERDFDGADKLLAATGDDQAVRDYLGLEGPPPPPPVVPGPTPAPPIQPPPGVTVAPGAVPPGQLPGQPPAAP